MLTFGCFDGSLLQSTTDEDCMFTNQLAFISVGVIRYKVVLSFASDNNFLYSLSTFMSACRSILCPIVVLPLFWHANVFTLFSLCMLNTMCICETDY